MSANCDNLDDYLAADLSAEDAAQFAEHLEGCDDCCDAVDQQRWIDGLLRDSADDEAELPPDDVLVTLRVSIDQYRARRKQYGFALAAVAMLLVAVGWFALNRQAGNVANDENAQSAVAVVGQADPKLAPRATFVSDSGSIAVPVKSRHADVTIVRVYPTLQPRYENQTAAYQPEAPVNQDWDNYSTGG